MTIKLTGIEFLDYCDTIDPQAQIWYQAYMDEDEICGSIEFCETAEEAIGRWQPHIDSGTHWVMEMDCPDYYAAARQFTEEWMCFLAEEEREGCLMRG